MTTNPNQDISEHLIKLGENERDVNQKVYLFFAYKKAANALATLETRVKSGSEAQKLPGIGPKVALIIEEYLQGGGESTSTTTIPSKESSKSKTKTTNASASNGIDSKILDHYDTLYLSKIEALRLQINQMNTIADLRDNTSLLTKPQIVCLKNFSDLCKPISREEIEKIAKHLKKSIEKISQHLHLTVCGAYRRGASESDRIDVLLVHSKIKSTKTHAAHLLKDTLTEVIAALEKEDFLKKRLKLEQDRFEGLIQRKHSAPHRRLSIRLVPKDHSNCGLFFLTGNDSFCEQVRQYALEKGYILDENCLRKIGFTCVPGQAIPVQSEEELFEYIDHQFVKPEQRNV